MAIGEAGMTQSLGEPCMEKVMGSSPIIRSHSEAPLVRISEIQRERANEGDDQEDGQRNQDVYPYARGEDDRRVRRATSYPRHRRGHDGEPGASGDFGALSAEVCENDVARWRPLPDEAPPLLERAATEVAARAQSVTAQVRKGRPRRGPWPPSRYCCTRAANQGSMSPKLFVSTSVPGGCWICRTTSL
jgi:hypothetical protein